MKIILQVFFLLPTISHLATSVSELCFYHNTSVNGVYTSYVQCGDLKSVQPPANSEDEFLLTQVYNIQIGWNTSLPELPYGLFTSFRYLENLVLDDANIERINPRAFYDMGQLQNLSLFNNKLSKLEPGIFNQLYTLRALNLGYNQIESLDENTFSTMYQLKKLVLKWNKIENVTRSVFSGLYNLQELNLAGNGIRTLTSDFFEDLFFLKSLDLSSNSLSDIPPTLFSKQRDLLKLNLESNHIEVLLDKLFENTVLLQFLDVSDNFIKRFNETILKDTVIEVFKFSRNHITKINATKLVSKAQWLEEVSIDHNPWNCNSLNATVEEFKKSQVHFEQGTNTKAEHNVHGIACKT